MFDVVTLLSRAAWFAGARREALNGPGDRENRLRWLARDVCGRICGAARLRGEAGEALSDVAGSVLEPAGAVFEPAAADFAGRSLLSDVGGMLHLPFAQFAGACRDALNGLGGRENRLRWLPGDVCGRIFGPAGLRGDAGEGLNDAPGSVLEPPGAVFEPGAADFAARSLFSDVGVMLPPAGCRDRVRS